MVKIEPKRTLCWAPLKPNVKTAPKPKAKTNAQAAKAKAKVEIGNTFV